MPVLDPFRLAADLLDPPLGGLPWRQLARPEQIAPSAAGVWYCRGGRGSGKTWAGSNNFAELITTSPAGEWGVVAPTYGDARNTCVESQESGLIKALGGKVGAGGQMLESGPYLIRGQSAWNRSLGELRLRNGSIVYVDGADDGALRIQGKNLRGLWADEIGLWKQWRTSWDESIKYAVRIHPARIIVTGTPKADRDARQLVRRLINDPDVAKSLMNTEDNIANLAPERVKEYLKLKDTRLGRQELFGELLEDVEGALWNLLMIETDRVQVVPSEKQWDPEVQDWVDVALLSVVKVAIDPAVTSSKTSDETGILIGALGTDGHAYILGDRSCRLTPERWATESLRGYDDYDADGLVAEVNNGGDLVETTIRLVAQAQGRTMPPYRKVHASRGKSIRAEPVITLYEQHKIHHVGLLPGLEDQQTTWVPSSAKDSPDRVDALVWLVHDLFNLDRKARRYLRAS